GPARRPVGVDALAGADETFAREGGGGIPPDALVALRHEPALAHEPGDGGARGRRLDVAGRGERDDAGHGRPPPVLAQVVAVEVDDGGSGVHGSSIAGQGQNPERNAWAGLGWDDESGDTRGDCRPTAGS